jgi:hypothetical protein
MQNVFQNHLDHLDNTVHQRLLHSEKQFSYYLETVIRNSLCVVLDFIQTPGTAYTDVQVKDRQHVYFANVVFFI